MIFVNILIIILLYSSFAVVHSLLAAFEVKRKLLKKFPSFMPFYRISYNVFALIHFYFVYELSPRIDIKLFDLQFPYDFLIYFFSLQSLLAIGWTLFYFDGKEFLGISQLFRRHSGEYNLNNLDEDSELIVKGPYLWCRHPLYFFCIMFLTLRPYMNLDYLVSLICIITYFYIGSIYEEKRMLKKFGAHYEEYMKHVPRLVPVFWGRKK